jgi:hypothetical protein
VLAVLGCTVLVLAGCASAQDDEVRRVATQFEDPAADPRQRCDLLIPTARAALEEEASAACPEVIQDVPLPGGEVEAVEVWGGDAQVRLSGDTLFLTQTRNGWRVTAAACTPRGERPYDCEVESS